MTEGQARPIIRRNPAQAETSALGDIHPLLQRIYSARGVSGAEELDYGLARLLPVSSLSGIDRAVDLLLDHRDRHIVIVGDFDADGATSTALVIRCLREFGISNVSYLVPNRFKFGYGLTPEIVEVAADRKPALLITVDNGISSAAGVNKAHELGIRVLITDHHLPPTKLPDADAIVNPNSGRHLFASPNLAGVGVSFYLMAALGRRFESAGSTGAARVPAKYLDLVALGTIADVVPLDHNNRILVSQGLQRIRAGHAVAGINALFRQTNRSHERAVSSDLGFIIGPRLNAAGRLEDMSVGIECLLTDEASTAADLAGALDSINRERREIESKMRDEAFQYVDSFRVNDLPACVSLYDPDWHQGVVGLIAARVRERCNRPVVAFAQDSDGMLKGSMRSVPGVHARDLLEAVDSSQPGVIERYGGHAMAAGLSIGASDFDAFSTAIASVTTERYPDADFSGAIMTDGELPNDVLNLKFAQQLRDAGPWGSGFPEPVFSGRFTVIDQRVVGENHLKMKVRTQSGSAIDAIAFGQAGPALRGEVELAYRLDVNEYRGFESAQLVVEQIVNTVSAP